MAQSNRDISSTPFDAPVSRAEAAAIDAGLRAYMIRVYNYMVLGLAVTAIAALGIYVHTNEEGAPFYIVRLVAYSLILLAIWHKNKPRP